MALRTLPHVSTYRWVEYFAYPPTWLTFPLPRPVTLNRQVMGPPILLQIVWILLKCWADSYCEEQLLFPMMQLSGCSPLYQAFS